MVNRQQPVTPRSRNLTQWEWMKLIVRQHTMGTVSMEGNVHSKYQLIPQYAGVVTIMAETCENYKWYYYASKDCPQIGEFGILEMSLLLLLAISIVIIVILSTFLIRYRRKLQRTKSKLQNPSLMYDYETYNYSNQSARLGQEAEYHTPTPTLTHLKLHNKH